MPESPVYLGVCFKQVLIKYIRDTWFFDTKTYVYFRKKVLKNSFECTDQTSKQVENT